MGPILAPHADSLLNGLGELRLGEGLGLAKQVGLRKVPGDESPRQAGLEELGPGGLRDRGRLGPGREGLGRRLGGHFLANGTEACFKSACHRANCNVTYKETRFPVF